MSGLVDKDHIRIANNSLISRVDELWVFGKVSDGVLIEIFLAKQRGIVVRYFIFDSDGSRFEEITSKDVELEDVSPWMWEWVESGKNLARWHPRLRFTKHYPVVYPAYSKKNFFWQMHISQFCIEKRRIPLNPFMLFRYFLGDAVNRKVVYQANRKIIDICDELWVFGDVADGVFKEIIQMKKRGGKVLYFKINDSPEGVSFRKIQEDQVVLEQELVDKIERGGI